VGLGLLRSPTTLSVAVAGEKEKQTGVVIGGAGVGLTHFSQSTGTTTFSGNAGRTAPLGPGGRDDQGAVRRAGRAIGLGVVRLEGRRIGRVHMATAQDVPLMSSGESSMSGWVRRLKPWQPGCGLRAMNWSRPRPVEEPIW